MKIKILSGLKKNLLIFLESQRKPFSKALKLKLKAHALNNPIHRTCFSDIKALTFLIRMFDNYSGAP